jgi:hypothetical protein
MQRLDHLSSPDSGASSSAANEAPTKPPENPGTPVGQNESADIQAAQLQNRATSSLKKFTQGVGVMDEANKRRRFGSKTRFAETRRMFDEADNMINEARQEKNLLLSELESQQIPDQQRADIVKLLEAIH